MPKGVGNKKGKQPAKGPVPKGPTPGQTGMVDLADKAGQQAILDQIEVLEKAHGFPAGGPLGEVPGKRGHLTRQASQQLFHSQIYQHLMSVTAKAAGSPGLGPDSAPHPNVQGQLDLVPRDPVSHSGGNPLPSGEYPNTPQPSWPWGPQSQTAASGSLGIVTLTQPSLVGGSAPVHPPLMVPGSGDGLVPDGRGLLIEDQSGSGSGGNGEPEDEETPGGGTAPMQPMPPRPDGREAPMPGQQSVPVDAGNLTGGSGILQPEVLMQLIPAVIAGVAPIAKAAFTGQQMGGVPGGGDETVTVSGLKKPK